MKKWSKLEEKGIKRYNEMMANGCEFAESFSHEGIDLDTVSVCSVSFII